MTFIMEEMTPRPSCTYYMRDLNLLCEIETSLTVFTTKEIVEFNIQQGHPKGLFQSKVCRRISDLAVYKIRIFFGEISPENS